MQNCVFPQSLTDEYILFQSDPKNSDYVLIKADILRRSGEFDELIEKYSDLIIGDEHLDKVITFQILKARQRDDGCYTVDDVKNEMKCTNTKNKTAERCSFWKTKTMPFHKLYYFNYLFSFFCQPVQSAFFGFGVDAFNKATF